VFKQECYPKWQQCYYPVSAQNKFYLKKNVKVYSKGSSREKLHWLEIPSGFSGASMMNVTMYRRLNMNELQETLC